MLPVAPTLNFDLLDTADRLRQEAGRGLDPVRRSELGQYFTPAVTARLMASMTSLGGDKVRVLDPGAGVGILTAAWVAEMCARSSRPREVVLTAYEVDSSLLAPLTMTLAACQHACEEVGVQCGVEIRQCDFIEDGVEALDAGLWGGVDAFYDVAILNPPYKKFRTDSRLRLVLRRLGIETSNLYTAFLSVAVRLLADGGEIVAITPRSFCNGPYFRPFRQQLLRSVSLTRLHVFESRGHAFREDEVLQENVILHARKGVPQQDHVVVSQTHSPEDSGGTIRLVPFDRVVQPRDPESFIHLVPDEHGHALAVAMRALPCTLDQIGVSVSTGRVVEFRARDWLRPSAELDTVALIYPTHFSSGYVEWPKPGKKPNAIMHVRDSAPLMVTSGVYVLVKRFSAKEERRRVVAAVFDPDRVPGDSVGFENHLNYFHADGAPLARPLALGLAAFLNSTQLDSYFRQFNGHTQVNATDLRALRYPTRPGLEALGERVGPVFPDQATLDALVAEAIDIDKS
jgi:adenine-specific DNA-methyltransferase